jgi:hypothetical protein
MKKIWHLTKEHTHSLRLSDLVFAPFVSDWIMSYIIYIYYTTKGN